MEKKKMLFVYNPKAGKGKIKNYLLDIIDIFVRGGYEIIAYPTSKQGDAKNAIVEMETDRYSLIVCCGGDGTLKEVVTGMMVCDEKLPIGYIPAGSTNDFAHSVGISDDMLAAAENIVNGKSALYDVGKFNDDTFVYIAAFGAFTEVSYETDQFRKNILGHMAYILEGVKSLSTIKSYQVKIESDETVIEDEIILGMITNSTSVGGFKNITGNNVKLNDGKFEVTLIKRPQNPTELNDMIVSLVSKRMNSECIYSFKTSHIKIKTQKAVNWTLDGEFGGCHEEVIISNMHKKLMLIE